MSLMLSSGIVEIMSPPFAVEGMKELGYPPYMMYILGMAKLIGVVVILLGRRSTIVEWAYAGFTIDFLGASASHALSGDKLAKIIYPLGCLVILLTAYSLGKKLQKFRQNSSSSPELEAVIVANQASR